VSLNLPRGGRERSRPGQHGEGGLGSISLLTRHDGYPVVEVTPGEKCDDQRKRAGRVGLEPAACGS
jgi:hypothetical protein